MPRDRVQQEVLIRRFRERRWLLAASVVVALGGVLTQGEEVWTMLTVHGLPFYLVHAVWLRCKCSVDPILLPVVYLLTGVGLMLMLSLSDAAFAPGFVTGSAAGTLLIGAVSFLDTRRAFWSRRHMIWLAASLGIALLLFAAGSGPAGSGARVNLDVPGLGRVQPVEALKLCLLLFMAGYFARNWTFLRELTVRCGRRLQLPRLRDVLPVTAGVAAALASCFLLRDMGPALVMGATFLFLYGAARGRLIAVIAGTGAMGAGFWIIYATRAVPVVAERMSMLLSPWDNFVKGGEHLAHAYWALASGGLTGVGLGRGSAAAIPAAHTDMVLPAVGEELGFVGLLALLILYGVLLVRALHAARRASGAFGLFLASGAALMLLFQLFLIAGGTTGLAPLSGVVTPFISYGKSSMLVNCALVGLIASISRTARPARPQTASSARRDGRRFAAPLGVAAGLVALLLAGIALRAGFVQAVQADDWVIRPALVPRQDGDRAFVYNPRIYEARRMLGRGTITDRNGAVLAVDAPGVGGTHDTSAGRDVPDRPTGRNSHDAPVRTYPLADTTFFLLGDVNGRVKWGADNSLYAEHRYLSYLRGYDNRPTSIVVDGRPVVRYDYHELKPLIGAPTPAAARILTRVRDLQLTVDVRLQRRTTQLLAELAPDGCTASAVVLDAFTGEVLASATVPLPELTTSTHEDPDAFDRGFGAGAKPPGSTFKLVTAMAALQAGGRSVQRWTHLVRAGDRYARRGEPTGAVDLRRALVSSSNVYFAALARERVGPERLHNMADAFGFRLGAPGPSPREQIDLLRRPDNLRQAGFGQGPVVASPLEVARVAAAVANGGVSLPPRWVRTSPVDGRPLPRNTGRRVIAAEHANVLGEAMRGVVLERRGTATLLRDSPIPIAGKTGTAEEEKPGEAPVNHAWFAGFAPYEGDSRGATVNAASNGSGRPDPAASIARAPAASKALPGGSRSAPSRRIIAVGVLVEEGGQGGTVAAPIARAVIEAAAELGIIDAPPPASPELSPSAASPSTLDEIHLISSSDR